LMTLMALRFNPRPRAGGDGFYSFNELILICFNPRPRAGGDLLLEFDTDVWIVSIHAPARGATLATLMIVPVPPRFNPRPRAGGDMMDAGLVMFISGFNPRPRAGGDLAFGDGPSAERFQSTPPRGGRRGGRGQGKGGKGVSIHAPARGATWGCSARWCLFSVSIHAPARGATRVLARIVLYIWFQSTPPRGGRRDRFGDYPRNLGFNPRPRAGGDISLYSILWI